MGAASPGAPFGIVSRCFRSLISQGLAAPLESCCELDFPAAARPPFKGLIMETRLLALALLGGLHLGFGSDDPSGPATPPPSPYPPPAPDDCIVDAVPGKQTLNCKGLSFDLHVPAVCLERACGFDHGRARLRHERRDHGAPLQALGAGRRTRLHRGSAERAGSGAGFVMVGPERS